MPNENQTDIIKKVLELLEEGDKKVTLDHHKDIVLVLGNTGSDKSTFVQYLSGNKALKSQLKWGSYIIVGDDSIQDDTTSKITFPELVLGGETLTMTALVLKIREALIKI